MQLKLSSAKPAERPAVHYAYVGIAASSLDVYSQYEAPNVPLQS